MRGCECGADADVDAAWFGGSSVLLSQNKVGVWWGCVASVQGALESLQTLGGGGR